MMLVSSGALSSAFSRFRVRRFVAAGLFCVLTLVPALLRGQQESHGRKYKPPPATAHIVVTVQKDFNGKPLVNAAVIFHATKGDGDTGNMEIKTNNQGQAIMDFIEAGSHVTVQIIANGFATDAEEFDVTTEDKNVLVKMKHPQAQVSGYQDNEGKPAQTQPGVQEREKPVLAPSPATAATGPTH